MKVALFTDSYLPTIDGVVNAVLTIKEGLKERGHEVLIFAPEHEDSPREENTVYCKARKFKMYPGYRLASFLPRNVKLLKEFNPDVIHTHGIGGMALKTLWLSKDLKIPTVLTFHTMVTDVVGQYSPLSLNAEFLNHLLKVYLRNIIQRFDIIIVPSAPILSEVEEIAPNIKHVEIVPTGVDCKKFSPDVDFSRIRDKWNLDSNRIILSVGRMAEEKKLEVIIKALPLVKNEVPDVKLILVGVGPALDKYKELVRSQGLDGDVVFTGFVSDDELPQYYASCNVFATASKFETQGLVILEALASGKPVAGANFRAIPEFVMDSKTGYLFEPDDVDSCGQALVKCLTSDPSFSKNAREIAKRHSVESSIEKLIGVYEDLINAESNEG
jgi:1,2-diacylglycerol 3-alpha-glucosyltransferase